MDVFNCGELRTTMPVRRSGAYYRKNWWYYSPDVYHAMDAWMAGKCSVGLAIEEILGVLDSLGFRDRPLALFGRGWPGIGLLFLSAVLPRVRACYLSRMPQSWEMLLKAGHLCLDINHYVPGVLAYTDIPLILHRNRDTRYVLADTRRVGRGGVNYSNRTRFPNVLLLRQENPGAAAPASG